MTATPAPLAGAEAWPYLPNDDIGAVDFRNAHPEWDGRGIVVAILDTGVDVFMPGMTRTSTGDVKVIETRDFSTEGEWKVEEAELDDSGTAAAPIFLHSSGDLLRGAAELSVAPATDDLMVAPVWMGVIAEREMVNSVGDLNDDGDSTDRFAFIAYCADRGAVESALGIGRGYEMIQAVNDKARAQVERERRSSKVWLVVVDTDADGDLADEELLRDYHVNYDAFGLTSPNAPDSRTLMSWEVNVLENENQHGEPEAPTVEFHFDDGSHGSHCSGIAAGFQVSGQDGLDGVAPGAWVMSLKLGDNRLSGGATRTESMKKCYEYAAEWSERWGIPVVINMSFGIASVDEADDSMGRWLDGHLAEHPGLYVCTSNGNEGPGISSTGLPATSYSVISSGASISVTTGRSLYNAKLGGESLFNFTSRGGEVAKPDIVSPGGCLSTVPGHVDGSARYNGTSMASPHTAGAIACLLSAAQSEGLKTHWGMVKRALIAGGERLDGFGLLDQGGGRIAMAATWDVLKKLAQSESAHDILWYRIETPCPFQDDGVGEAAYWRTPGGTPFLPETVTFTVHPVFHPDLTADERDTFFRSFDFRSEADWLKLVSDRRYIRGDMGMEVIAQYDADKLRDTGLHAARIVASLEGGDLGGLAAREFYLWNSVVRGDRLDADNDYRLVYSGRNLMPFTCNRYFVEVPASVSALRVRLEVSGDTGAGVGDRARFEVFDPEGHVVTWSGYASVGGERLRNRTLVAEDVYAGLWEIDVYPSRYAMDASDYEISISCDGYEVEPAAITKLKRPDTGDAATGEFEVLRTFGGVFRGTATATIAGFGGDREVEITDTDTWTHDFTLDEVTPRVTFHLEMTEAVGNYFTDCAVDILDESGASVASTGFNGVSVDLQLALPTGSSKGSYTLKVTGGFAIKEEMADWGFTFSERYSLASPVTGTASRAGGGDLDLFCGVPTPVNLNFADNWPTPPDGLTPWGHVRFRDTDTADKAVGDDGGRLVLEVPILLD